MKMYLVDRGLDDLIQLQLPKWKHYVNYVEQKTTNSMKGFYDALGITSMVNNTLTKFEVGNHIVSTAMMVYQLEYSYGVLIDSTR